ncbi:hypothetical protein [Streptomyces sp. NBRC 109706]|uniref:hypothetical protein n=1 Tax=Streptomyces sp. NBRC 109706 TaxID=1550035 RepID=UPI001F38BBF8|nr:hypothetical protein [Streptomyces sp. NBRC 109706]
MAPDADEPDAALGYQPARETLGGAEYIGGLGDIQHSLSHATPPPQRRNVKKAWMWCGKKSWVSSQRAQGKADR